MNDYLSRFGFNTTPFTKEIPVNHFFSHSMFDEVFHAFVDIIEHRMCAALIAPAGVGKTCILRKLRSHLPEARYRINYIMVSELAKRDMCREISEAIGCRPAGAYNFLIRNLQQHFMQNMDTDGLRSVLIIDESHGMKLEVLSMLKVLCNFEMDSRLVVSIILCGKSPLRNMLSRADMEDVARRFSHYATLRPFTRDETFNYIKHRCAIDGVSSLPFDSGAMDAIFEIARGNMRAIDELSRKSMQVAHENDCDTVDSNHVAEARKYLWP